MNYEVGSGRRGSAAGIIFSIQVHTSHIPHTYRNVHISRSIGLCVLSAFHACRYTAHDRSLSRHRRQLSPVPMLVACAARSRRYSPPEQRHDQCIRAPPINTHHLPKRTPSGPAIAAAAIGDSPPRPAVQRINTHTKNNNDGTSTRRPNPTTAAAASTSRLRRMAPPANGARAADRPGPALPSALAQAPLLPPWPRPGGLKEKRRGASGHLGPRS